MTKIRASTQILNDDGHFLESADAERFISHEGGLKQTLEAHGERIVGLGVPVGDQDAATKKYVDDAVGSIVVPDPDTIEAGDGLSKVGSTLSVRVDGDTITVGPDGISVNLGALGFISLSDYVCGEEVLGDTLANAPAAGTEMIFVNGLLQHRGVDYTLSGSTIEWINGPNGGDTITATYFKN